MRTGQVGEWGANKKKAAGVMKHTAPDSGRGILSQWQRLRAKFYCRTHGDLQAVASVQGIKQLPESAEYQVTLTCGCSRQVLVNVQRTAAVKQQLTDEQEREQEQEQAELSELRASAGTL